MHKSKAALVGLLCLVAMSGCYTNTNPGDVTFTTIATMQLAVGTINDTAGVLQAGAKGGALAPGSYLNAVATFRNQFGNSAFLSPGTATLTPGSGAGNIGTLFSYGQSPGHNGTTAQAPAFAAPGSGTGYLKDNTLLTPGLPPLPGAVPTSYTLATDVAVSGGTKHYSGGATLVTLANLPFNGNCAYAADAAGGGTMTCPAAPAGVEQVMMVLVGATIATGIRAVVEVPAGATTFVVPDGTFPTPAAARTAFMIDADYPFVEAGPVNSPAVGTSTPVITNTGVAVPNGQADLAVGAYFGITI